VPDRSVYADALANNTWENATRIKAMLGKRDIGTVVLVTSAWHMPRSVWCFEAQGLQVIAAPVDFVTEKRSYDLRSYLPHWSTLNDSALALHEYLGFLWYRLRYG